MNEERFYGTGHRKNAVARVWLMRGTGKITVNKKPMKEYVSWWTRREELLEPFKVTGTLGEWDVWATTKGGGIIGQAGALRHGIAKALVEVNPEWRGILKKSGLLTRDPRMKERKKFGRKRARRGFQFSKR
ncbi:MAG TPA: 30S ribosomal protein S9 [Armatimonadetes bacterium]|nr:30S ribosomal protein S9 [Armatimonadota bacterium]